MSSNDELVDKIARLIEEGGWTQDSFARHAGLNRHTVRKILVGPDKPRLRNATVSACAQALGVGVNELRAWPLERLINHLPSRAQPDGGDQVHLLYEEATQPALRAWLEQNPERARQMGRDELDELRSIQGVGGPLALEGVEHFVAVIERKRRLIQQIHAIAGTDHLELLERFVDVLYESIQPYGARR